MSRLPINGYVEDFSNDEPKSGECHRCSNITENLVKFQGETYFECDECEEDNQKHRNYVY